MQKSDKNETNCFNMAANQIDAFDEMDPMEENLAMSTSNLSDTFFDVTVGHIEDIIMEDEFQLMQTSFLDKHCMEFEDSEENKFVYTDIHKEYVDVVEKYIVNQLTLRMPDFSMSDFSKQLIDRRDELEGEVFEILLTFSDFMAFKEMILDYRWHKEGRTIDLSDGVTVTSLGNGVLPQFSART